MDHGPPPAARRAVRIFLAVVSFGLIAPQPAVAFHADEAALLSSGTAPGPAWASYSFSTVGTRVITDVVASEIGYPVQAGIYTYSGNDRLVFGISYTILGPDQGIYVDVNQAGQNIHVDVTEPQFEGGTLRLGATMNDPSSTGEPAVGPYKQLLWIGGTASRVDYSLRGDPGVQHLGTDSGRRTFLHTSRDFEGTVNVKGGAGGLEARVNADTHLVLDAQDTLIGFFRPLPGAAGDMSVDGPHGRTQCPCTFPNFIDGGEGSMPPFAAGRYRFNLTGVGATTTTHGEIVLGGADARLP